jgi:hypothetical protein
VLKRDILSTFAGPFATVTAATVAVGVTAYFNSKQVKLVAAQTATAAAQKEIAQAQRDIAFDRLKYDLFEKRYAIYLAAKGMIAHTLSPPFGGAAWDEHYFKLKAQVDEACFFYGLKAIEVFTRIFELTEIIRIAKAGEASLNEDEGFNAKQMAAKYDAELKLADLYTALPRMMGAELGFAQLTSRGGE